MLGVVGQRSRWRARLADRGLPAAGHVCDRVSSARSGPTGAAGRERLVQHVLIARRDRGHGPRGKMQAMGTSNGPREEHSFDRREFLDLAVGAVGLPGGASSFGRGSPPGTLTDSSPAGSRPSRRCCANYSPTFFDADGFRRAPGVHRDSDPHRRDPGRPRGALRALHRLRSAGVAAGSTDDAGVTRCGR